MEWVRGIEIGSGSFSTVNLAISKNPHPQFPQIMAVKSTDISQFDMLLREKSILEELKDCPQITRCFGGDYSVEEGEKVCNLFLEYATGGTLADKMKKSCGGRLSESEARRYTKSILEGIKYVNEKGYVHCDIKLENILLFPSPKGSDYDEVKIADFGLATRAGEKVRRERGGVELRGTPLNMSPEAVTEGKVGAAGDVWAVGCMVAEMVTGAPAWQCREGTGVFKLLVRIGVGDELPEIPKDLSSEGRDFLSKIFVKDPTMRWTAKMLLDHPFITDQDCKEDRSTTSPRGPLDCIDDYESVQSLYLNMKPSSPNLDTWSSVINTPSSECDTCCSSQVDSVRSPTKISKLPLLDFDTWSSDVSFDSEANRLQHLVTSQEPDWNETDNWITVRR